MIPYRCKDVLEFFLRCLNVEDEQKSSSTSLLEESRRVQVQVQVPGPWSTRVLDNCRSNTDCDTPDYLSRLL